MIKKWEKYENFLKTGAWHIHTNFTDGENSVFEYCQRAKELGMPFIAFIEHIRKRTDYNFKELAEEVKKAKKRFNLKIILGCEAKVLNKEGNLDASESVFKKSDIVLGVFHDFISERKKDYLEALKNMLKNPYVDIWGHPGLFYTRHNMFLTKAELNEISKLCVKNKVLLEINFRYNLPEENLFSVAKKNKVKFIHGLDAHSIKDLDLLVEYLPFKKKYGE